MKDLATSASHEPGEAPPDDEGDDDPLARQRSSFIRGCGYVGITLVVLGAAGLARLTFLGLGGLALVFGVLAYLIGLEPDLGLAEGWSEEDGEASGESDGEAGGDVPEPSTAVEAPSRTVVRFRLPAAVGATTVHLVGEFNDWSRTRHPLRRDGDCFRTEVELELGRIYRYRYLLDGSRWENAWDADAYLPNEHGSEDSVVDLRRPPESIR